MPKRLIRPAALSAVLAMASAATGHAQAISVYGTFSPVHVSGVRNGSSSTSADGYSTTSYWAPGVGGGVTFGALSVGPVFLGLDLRGSTRPGQNGADTVLGGVKLGLKLPFVRFKPYVQASGGYLATRARIVNSATAGSTQNDHFAAYEILGGVDYKFLPILDLRLVEIGGGEGYYLSGAGTGSSSSTYHPSLLTVSTGVVLHF